MCFPETNFRIPLLLWGTFSYFVTSKPAAEFMQGTDDVCMLTPSRWNPHCDAHAMNEDSMLDWEGNLIEKRDRSQIMLSDVCEDTALASSLLISSPESRVIYRIFQGRNEEIVHPSWKPIPPDIQRRLVLPMQSYATCLANRHHNHYGSSSTKLEPCCEFSKKEPRGPIRPNCTLD
jgi:hypothetical protein